jgi:hypothetical protein
MCVSYSIWAAGNGREVKNHVKSPLAYKLLQIMDRDLYYFQALALVCVHRLFPGGCMKLSTILCCGLIAAGSAGSALAAPQGGGMGFSHPAQDQRSAFDRERERDRAAPQRDMRGSGDADRGRMNPDERRQLRRDIQDAGRDIYRPAPQRRGDPRRPESR